MRDSERENHRKREAWWREKDRKRDRGWKRERETDSHRDGEGETGVRER